MLKYVRNVSGFKTEKTMISAMSRISRPQTETARVSASAPQTF